MNLTLPWWRHGLVWDGVESDLVRELDVVACDQAHACVLERV